MKGIFQKSKSKITIITPIYNAEQTLEDCLNSVILQTKTFTDFEVVCVDDGSTDNTPAILERYSKDFDFIRLHTQANSGSGAARNKALEFASGEFVAFIDADDLYPSNDILRKLYDSAIGNNVKICGGCFNLLDIESGAITDEFDFPLDGYTFKESKVIDYEDYQFDFGYHRFIYNLHMLRENDITFPGYRRFQDPPFFVKAMVAAGKFYALNEVTYLYRLRDNPVTWDETNVCDLMRGIHDVLNISIKNNLQKLSGYVYQRFKNHMEVITEQSRFSSTVNKFFVNLKNEFENQNITDRNAVNMGIIKSSNDQVHEQSEAWNENPGIFDATEKDGMMVDISRKTGEKYINIAFVTDDKYVTPTVVAITSLMDHIGISTKYNIFIITAGLSKENEKLFNSFNTKHYNISLKIVKSTTSIEELSKIHGETLESPDFSVYLSATPTALLKFEISELLPNIDKILYLDSDILIQDDLIDLFNIDLNDNYVAAVRDLPQVLYDNQRIGGDITGRDYFNSGVMLLNLKKMRKNNTSELLIATKINLQDKTLMDQNVFNMVFKDNIMQLSFLYNFCYTNMERSKDKYDIKQLNQCYRTHYSNFNEIIPDIKIVHFSSKVKPWDLFDLPFADKWIYYYFKSPVAGIPIQRIDSKQYDEKEIGKIRTETLKASQKIDFDGNIIPIVFCTNNDYAPFCATAIQSIIDTASRNNYYDIYIFYDNELWWSSQDRLKLMSKGINNINITLFNVEKAITQNVLYSCAHYSKQMYYRWLIPEVLTKYSKVLYLDCDVIAVTDVAELFFSHLDNCIIGAINNFCQKEMETYLINQLYIPIEEYINSGILIINSKKFLLEKTKDDLMQTLIKKRGLRCPDQDVLNIVCNGKIKYLDYKWNFQWHHFWPIDFDHRLTEYYKPIFNNLIDNFAIIHYTSGIKPWIESGRRYAHLFWVANRKTLFYEETLINSIKVYTNTLIATKSVEMFPTNSAQLHQHKNETEARIATLEYENKQLEEEVNFYRKELDGTRKSLTFRIGRIFTFIPFQIRNLIKQKR